MPMLIAGLLLVWLSSILLRGFARANPVALARLVRKGGGTLALVMATLLIVRGEFNLALLAAGAGLWLLSAKPGLATGKFAFSSSRWRRQGDREWQQPSGVRSRTLDLLVDPITGRVDGRFRAGPCAGWHLDALSQAQLLGAYQWCLMADPSGATLLEPYLDRRFPGWRDAAEVAGDAGRTEPGRRPAHPARMSDHEAYHVLGLAQGAGREEIARAHRRLMKKHHPDHGGSTDMAARVNEAKDVLMRRHP